MNAKQARKVSFKQLQSASPRFRPIAVIALHNYLLQPLNGSVWKRHKKSDVLLLKPKVLGFHVVPVWRSSASEQRSPRWAERTLEPLPLSVVLTGASFWGDATREAALGVSCVKTGYSIKSAKVAHYPLCFTWFSLLKEVNLKKIHSQGALLVLISEIM